MKVITLQEGQPLDEATLAQSGMPPELIAFLTALGAVDEPLATCDCPPGVCLGDELSSGPSDDLDDEEDDEFDLDVEFEPDFDLSDEPAMTEYDRVEAIAQLGRIVENLSVLSQVHANLLSKLVS